MAKQVQEIETLRQTAGLKTAAAEKFIFHSKSDTKTKISLERSISKSTKDNLKSKIYVLKKQTHKVARCNKAYMVTIKKQAGKRSRSRRKNLHPISALQRVILRLRRIVVLQRGGLC